jgi:hypothetical protein
VAYLYETHLHTSEVSKCAISEGVEYIACYKKMGYTGIIVTDHFYNGNCALSRKLPWDEWVNRFCRGYENAKKEGDRQGLDVFFGWEETFEDGDDYLVYGLDKQWLLRHPEARNWTRKEQYRAVRDGGGCVVQAHPFRQRFYIDKIVLSAGCVDGVEVANGGHEDISFDALACRYAKKLGKTMIAGTDIHEAGATYYDELFGVYSDKKLNNIGDFVNMVLKNEVSGIKTDDNRLEFFGTEILRTSYEIRDENDKIIKKHWKELMY